MGEEEAGHSQLHRRFLWSDPGSVLGPEPWMQVRPGSEESSQVAVYSGGATVLQRN